MKKHFITYGDNSFAEAKKRILREASSIGWFDIVKGYDENDISKQLKSSKLMTFPRGGGFWAWKPDIISKAILESEDGDIIIYADSGCSLQKCKEWETIEQELNQYDLIAEMIYQQTDRWTRKEIIEHFKDNPEGWITAPQHCATVVILRVTEFTRRVINEWRNIVLDHTNFIMDVSGSEREVQHSTFFENRHDQSIYSALIYKYLRTGKILSKWERIEGYDPIDRQAIRATRLRKSNKESRWVKIKGFLKRFIKIYILQKKWNKKLITITS